MDDIDGILDQIFGRLEDRVVNPSPLVIWAIDDGESCPVETRDRLRLEDDLSVCAETTA